MLSQVLLRSEFLKTKRSAASRLAFVGPCVLSIMALVQMGYFSINLFNWYYVIFLPLTIAGVSASTVRLDYGLLGLRTLRTLPVCQESLWFAKLVVVGSYTFASCLLLSCSTFVVPGLLTLIGIAQSHVMAPSAVLFGTVVMYILTLWQVPLMALLAKRFALIACATLNLVLNIAGVIMADGGYWFLNPWSWVMRAMSFAIGVLPNGLPVEGQSPSSLTDVVVMTYISLAATALLSVVAVKHFAKTEAR